MESSVYIKLDKRILCNLKLASEVRGLNYYEMKTPLGNVFKSFRR